MSIFAPVYRPSKHQQTFLLRQQKLANKKRKRDQDSGDEDGFRTPSRQRPDGDVVPRTPASAFHPVNKTDPYHVAGHPRELPLPPPPFPHAAVRDVSEPKRPIEEELAKLNPPLYVQPAADDKSTSLKRRHLDNLTTILHTCMLKGDWQRAYRAWSLIIRTEIAGRGVDVRRNGRWGIGAELLMRRKDASRGEVTDLANDDIAQSEFSLEGFKLARDYYERLILQYPHTARSSSGFNATAIYPALFNIWIYEVQDRSKRARKAFHSDTPDQNQDKDDGPASHQSFDTEQSNELQRIRLTELEQAEQIAQRMDELFQTPPYDKDTELRRLRGMVALWVADLCDEMVRLFENRDEVNDLDGPLEVDFHQETISRHRERAEEERRVAERSFEKAGGRD